MNLSNAGIKMLDKIEGKHDIEAGYLSKAERPQGVKRISSVVRRIAFQRRRHWIELFICHMIDNYERGQITEEGLQIIYSEFAQKYKLI